MKLERTSTATTNSTVKLDLIESSINWIAHARTDAFVDQTESSNNVLFGIKFAIVFWTTWALIRFGHLTKDTHNRSQTKLRNWLTITSNSYHSNKWTINFWKQYLLHLNGKELLFELVNKGLRHESKPSLRMEEGYLTATTTSCFWQKTPACTGSGQKDADYEMA